MNNQPEDDLENFSPSNCNSYDLNNIKNCDEIVNSKFNLIHINIQSCNRNLGEFLSFLDCTKVKFPIIMLSETWLKNEDDWINIPNYTAFHSCRKDGNKEGYGGVSILLHDKLNGEIIPSLTSNNTIIESIGIKTEINKKKINLVCIYRPPVHTNETLDNFNEALSGFIDNLPRNEINFLGGDINININSTNLSNSAKNFQELLASESYYPLITLPTRVTPNSSTYIDHLFTNTLLPIESGTLDCGITDHRAIFCTIPTNSISDNDLFELKFRDHSELNIDRLRLDLLSKLSNFEEYKDFSLDSKIQIFENILSNCYKTNCPVKIKQISYRNLTSPWISDSIKRCIKHKQELLRLSRVNPQYRGRLKAYQYILRKVIKTAKDSYYLSKFNAIAGDVKKTWKTIKSLIQSKSRASEFKININGAMVKDPIQISENFNDYFASIGPKLAANIPQTNTDPLSFIDANQNSFMFFDCTVNEVHNVIKNLKNKRKGLDEIPIAIYKKICDIISKFICDFINNSMSTGVFPDSLKIARIVPIHKSGSKRDTNNFRPISILPTLSKVFEKVMHKRMMKFIEKYKLLYSDQYGFRNRKSTSDAILKFTDLCYEALNDKKSTISVYLDFSKAFDTINHQLLCAKLDHYGFRGSINNWFKSYLNNRKQYVNIGNSESSLKDIKFGVPQGSILGPLLFILYINDMSKCTQLKLLHFADDSTAFMPFRNPISICSTINSELLKIDDWVRANQLSLNASKTTYSIFSAKKINLTSNITIRNTNIARSQCQKFLGVLLDENLNFQAHINSICLKVSRATGIIRKMKDIAPPNILMKLYYALAYPHITYAIEVWGKSSKTAIKRLTNKLSRVQKLMPMNESNRLLKYEQIYSLFCLVKFHKYYIMEENIYFQDKFRKLQASHNINTRHNFNNLFNTPSINSSKIHRSFYYFSMKKWNLIPASLRSINKPNSFKKQLKKHLSSTQ